MSTQEYVYKTQKLYPHHEMKDYSLIGEEMFELFDDFIKGHPDLDESTNLTLQVWRTLGERDKYGKLLPNERDGRYADLYIDGEKVPFSAQEKRTHVVPISTKMEKAGITCIEFSHMGTTADTMTWGTQRNRAMEYLDMRFRQA